MYLAALECKACRIYPPYIILYAAEEHFQGYGKNFPLSSTQLVHFGAFEPIKYFISFVPFTF